MTEQTTPTNEEELKAAEASEAESPVDGDATASPSADVQTDSSEKNAELAATKAEAQKNLEGWQRSRAEFANYKKRVERERLETYENATIDVMKSILSIIDDFDRAIENIPEELKNDPWIDGTVAIQRKLHKVLETHDITVIDPVGEPFDPDRHQGLDIVESTEVASGHVAETLQKGYAKGDKLLRPALVRVAS